MKKPIENNIDKEEVIKAFGNIEALRYDLKVKKVIDLMKEETK